MSDYFILSLKCTHSFPLLSGADTGLSVDNLYASLPSLLSLDFQGASSLEATFLRPPSRRVLESEKEREETIALAVAGACVGIGRLYKLGFWPADFGSS